MGEVYSAGFPQGGVEVLPSNPGNMGIGGPNLPGRPFDQDSNLLGISRFLGNGVPPKQHGHATLKSFDFVNQQYMMPPTTDMASRMIKPGMPCFCIRYYDKDDHSTIIYPLFMLNQLSRDQWNDFVLRIQYQNSDESRFLELMRKHGDMRLLKYAHAKETGDWEAFGYEPEKRNGEDDDSFQNRMNLWSEIQTEMATLEEFKQMAEQDGYCYLTLYGWTHKVNFIGANINTNMGAGLEAVDQTESMMHYTQATQGLGKRVLYGQCFGESSAIHVGTKLWITLRREVCGDGEYGCFVLYPEGSDRETGPLHAHFRDEKGLRVPALVYNVGTVLDPPNLGREVTSVDDANNTTGWGGVQAAYDAFAGLPTMFVNAGFNQ